MRVYVSWWKDGSEIGSNGGGAFLLGSPNTQTKEMCLLGNDIGANVIGNISSARSWYCQVLPR